MEELKLVKCTSCSPNGNLPIMVVKSNGLVLHYAEILNHLIKIDDISVFVSVDALLGGYIRFFENTKNKNSSITRHDIPAVLELIELFNRMEDLKVLEPAVQILLFSIIQSAKRRLNHDDPVRMAIEHSEPLGNLFLQVLSSMS